MFLLVEGPDGAGKTTIINKLLHKFPETLYLHFSTPTDYRLQFNLYKNAIIENQYAPFVIFDRCWYSDAVYGIVMRGREEITKQEIKELEQAIISCGGGLVAYVMSDTETMWNRCQARGEDYIKSIEQLEKIVFRYEQVMFDIGLPMIEVRT